MMIVVKCVAVAQQTRGSSVRVCYMRCVTSKERERERERAADIG